MEYGQAKAALLKSAKERQARLVKELAEVEATIKSISAGPPKAAQKKQGRGNGNGHAAPTLRLSLIHI